MASATLADGPRMENTLPVSQPREGGPLFVMGELQWDSPELLEGRLQYVIRDGREVLSVVVTDPMVVPAGGVRLRQLLPVPQAAIGFGMSEIGVSFLEEGKTHRLGDIGVTLPQPSTWGTVVLSVEPTSGAGLSDGEVVRREIELTSAFDEQNGFKIQSFSPVLAANELSEQSLSYCAFDAVLISAEAFKRLSLRQLGAISDWARAGGAVCVIANGALEQKQSEFLDSLFRGSDVGPFVRDSEGKVIEPDGTRGGVFARRAGVGHGMVLFRAPGELDFRSAEWRAAHARFWRLRDRVVRRRQNEAAPLTTDFFRPSLPVADPSQPNGFVAVPQSNYEFHPGLWTFPTPGYGTGIVEALRPQNLRMIPGWVVMLILFGYVAVIAPGEYWLLGKLKMRKWTWVTFPAVTIALTWAVVATADSFMSANDHVRSVDIVDLDAAGEPVRRTRLELLFQGSSTRAIHESKREFFSPLDQRHFISTYNQFGQPSATGHSAPTGPYTGSFPSRYETPQVLAKWTPQVNRTFEIAPEIERPKIDWKSVEAATSPEIIEMPGGRKGHRVRIISGEMNGATDVLGRVGDQAAPYGLPYQPVTPFSAQVPAPSGPLFLLAATAPQAEQRSSLQFQRSPLGLGRLDDLPFVDSSVQGDGAVIVWTQDDAGNFTVYRKPIAHPESNETDRL
ncbi:MAG: hypothetical protein H0T47_10595 [Planctomycetaceae bacterium]|nr:hypothetical protein [Planctomycetaceae bacterium]